MEEKPPDKNTKQIREREVIVSDVIRETPDSATLVLSSDEGTPEYKAGQFLTIDPHQFPALDRWCRYLEGEKGKKEPPRAYSLASAPHEEHVSFTVKESQYYPGDTPYPPLISPLLTYRVPVGTKMTIKGYTGSYVIDEKIVNNSDHVLHICAGSGIVPNFSIIKDELINGSTRKHTLIYTNKTWDDSIYRDVLIDMENEYAERIKVLHAITREENEMLLNKGIRIGRPDIEFVKNAIEDVSSTSVFICGPAVSSSEKKEAKKSGVEPKPMFLETMIAYLNEIGIPSERIKKESW